MLNASIRAVRDVRFMADHERMEHAVRSIATMGEPCEHDDEGLSALLPLEWGLAAERGQAILHGFAVHHSQEFRRGHDETERSGSATLVGGFRPWEGLAYASSRTSFVICPGTFWEGMLMGLQDHIGFTMLRPSLGELRTQMHNN